MLEQIGMLCLFLFLILIEWQEIWLTYFKLNFSSDKQCDQVHQQRIHPMSRSGSRPHWLWLPALQSQGAETLSCMKIKVKRVYLRSLRGFGIIII